MRKNFCNYIFSEVTRCICVEFFLVMTKFSTNFLRCLRQMGIKKLGRYMGKNPVFKL